MTTERRFELELPDRIADLAMPVRPDYRDDIVRQTATMRQRPAWTLLERWIPMSVTVSRVAVPPRFPLRILAVAALLLIVAAGAILVVGSRSHLPAPFGRAANGLVAYSDQGDIYTVDPTTGRAAGIMPGADTNRDPVFSRDGTHLVFYRLDPPLSPMSRLFVSASDGSGVTAITPDPLSHPGWYRFSPDGRQVAFVALVDDSQTLMVANTDGSGVRTLDVGMAVGEPSWLPPDGREIVFTSVTPEGVPGGLYAVNVKTGKTRAILAPSPGVGIGAATASPDGRLIAYSQSDASVTDRNSYQVHVVRSDGAGGGITLPMPSGAVFQDRPVWSNDGTRLGVVRGYAPHNEDVRVAILPADGSNIGVETASAVTGCCDNLMEWAPDDSAILLMPEDRNGTMTAHMLVDSSTGRATVTSWRATSFSSWQRRAP